jgi:radical SAM superfamily enzyme YgiQ (UPF0313 family)
MIRKKFPRTPIILGGEHITAVFEEALLSMNDPLILCVLGEGENTLKDLALFYDNKGPQNVTGLGDIQGVAFLESSQKVRSSRRDRIKKLDEILWPAWHLFPMENYVTRGISYLNKRTIPMLTSRGCPYRCKFCSAPQTWGTETYLRSPHDILKEIELYVERYHVEHIEFMDLVGVVNKRWTLELSNLLIEKKPGVTFSFAPGTRSEILDHETLTALKKAGIIRVMYAPDSGSSAEAKKIKKFINFEKLISSLRECIKLGIPTRVVTIIGFPNQTYKELLTSILFTLKCTFLGTNDIFINNFVPYSGSEFYDELKKRKGGFKLKDYSSFTIGQVESLSDEIPSWLLTLVRNGLMAFCIGLQYLLRPWRIAKSIIRLSRGEPMTLTENYIYLKFKYKTNFRFGENRLDYRF